MVPLDKLRVALLVDSQNVTKYEREFFDWAKKQKFLEVTALAIKKPRTCGGISSLIKGSISQWIHSGSLFLISRIEQLRLQNRKGPYKDHLKRYPLSELGPSFILLGSTIARSDHLTTLSSANLDTVRALNLDLIVCLGSATLPRILSSVSTFGAITAGSACPMTTRVDPIGFWEVFHRKDTTRLEMRHTALEPDNDTVLYQGRFQTQQYFLLNQACLKLKSQFFVRHLITQVAKTRTLLSSETTSTPSCRSDLVPNLGIQILYIVRLLTMLTEGFVNTLFLKQRYRWGVAFAKGDWSNVEMSRATCIKNPPNHYLADPFVIRHQDKDYCFVEDYSYAQMKGCIAVYELGTTQSRRIGEAITESFHLSFPFLFAFQNQVYMCPETGNTNEIRVYENLEFPLKWRLSKVIMKNVSAADSMIFHKNDRWWLFTNIDPIFSGDHSSMLYIFHADSPLSNSWIPHRMNPVIVDPCKARNGGILIEDESVYRVSQRQRFGFYGASIAINKISTLTADEYIEEEISRIDPDFFVDIAGTHQFHSNGHFTAFDFVSLEQKRNFLKTPLKFLSRDNARMA